ncbi:hypothetical protein TYRP_006518 [Tyrophagus putrescentiae]|nr:hypothetical protein TYRP_006518 [Tyrophagus putrescentiae]
MAQRRFSLAQNLLGQFCFTCTQSLRLFLQAATPLKSLDNYRRYFVTVEQVTATGAVRSKDRRTIGLCIVYSCLLAYFVLLNVFHFFVPLDLATRMLLGDTVAALALDAQFNLIFASLSLYAIHINWAMEAQLCGLLRQNAALFRFVFAGSAFYGGNFLLYMILHVPIAAVFSMEVLFNKHQSANSSSGSGSIFGLSQIFMTGNVSEAGIGTFLIHLYCAYFSKYHHRNGQMLLKFSGTKRGVELSPQTQIFVWVHTQRLWVRKKYGVTYGGLSLITLGSFFKFVLFFGKLLMTSYGLVN